MDRATLIRSYQSGDLGFILHSRHQYHWHTGYVPPRPWRARTSARYSAHARPARMPAMPAFIDIGSGWRARGDEDAQGVSAWRGSSAASTARSSSPSRRTRRRRCACQGHRRRVASRIATSVQEAAGAATRPSANSGAIPEGIGRAARWSRIGCSPAPLPRRSISRSSEGVYDQYNTGRFGLGCCSRGGSSNRGALRRSDDRIHSVRVLGHDDNGHERART